MASSPPAPFPAALPKSKKRASMSSQASGPGASKRPKLHPLRQTSFPAQDTSGRYNSAVTSARSETGSIANSLLSSLSNKVKGRGRGRPRKSAQLDLEDIRSTQQARGDTASQIDGDSRAAGQRAKSVVSARSGAAEQEDDDENDIDELVENMDEQEQRQAEEEEKRQEQRRERLVDTLGPDSSNRFNQWRALSLNTSTVKRLVNSIVSQSVTAAPLQAVKVYGKWFVGEIVERAREVQTECAEAYEETIKAERLRREKELVALEEKQKTIEISDSQSRTILRDIEKLRKEVKEYIPNPHKGGLLPDHLREALRRYKNDGEGGGVGFQGMSHGLLGVPGTAAWRIGDGTSGRRLFR